MKVWFYCVSNVTFKNSQACLFSLNQLLLIPLFIFAFSPCTPGDETPSLPLKGKYPWRYKGALPKMAKRIQVQLGQSYRNGQLLFQDNWGFIFYIVAAVDICTYLCFYSSSQAFLFHQNYYMFGWNTSPLQSNYHQPPALSIIDARRH